MYLMYLLVISEQRFNFQNIKGQYQNNELIMLLLLQ